MNVPTYILVIINIVITALIAMLFGVAFWQGAIIAFIGLMLLTFTNGVIIAIDVKLKNFLNERKLNADKN